MNNNIPKYILDAAYKQYRRVNNIDCYFSFYLKAFYAGFKYCKNKIKNK